MKKNLAFLALVLPLFITEKAYSEDVNINCDSSISSCETKTIVDSYLNSQNSYDQYDTNFNIYDQNTIIETISLQEYKDKYKKDGPVATMDAGLDCRYAFDSSCAEWFDNELIRQVYNVEWEFVVTQEYIDGDEYARARLIDALGGVAFFKVINWSASISIAVLPESVIQATAAALIGASIQKFKDVLRLDRSILEVGDKIKGKGNIITRVSISDLGDSNGGGGTGGGTGGSTDGGNGNGTIVGGGSGSGSTCKAYHYINGSVAYVTYEPC